MVYNWQYVHCLLLWAALIGEDRSEELRLLLYPLTQVCRAVGRGSSEQRIAVRGLAVRRLNV